jgi:hypothetical protein
MEIKRVVNTELLIVGIKRRAVRKEAKETKETKEIED